MEDQQKENLHDTAALRALADGFAVDTDDTPVDGDHEQAAPVNTDDNFVSEAQFEATANMAAAASPAATAANRKARSNQFAQKQAHAFAGQFRKVAIPLLLAMCLLLWIVGGITINLTNGSDPSEYADNPLMANGKLFAIICFVLGAALAAGAGLFQWEVMRAAKRQAQQ